MTPRARPATLDDLKKLLAALHKERADYLLIGAYALLAHGYPRATVDIDLIVPARELAPEWFEEGEGIRLADEIVVDLVFRTCGETFETLRPFEITIDLDGVPLRTVNLEGLLRTKQSGRERDVSDRRIIEQALQARRR